MDHIIAFACCKHTSNEVNFTLLLAKPVPVVIMAQVFTFLPVTQVLRAQLTSLTTGFSYLSP